MTRIDIALIAHTNVGKTSLARTLLRKDIGRVIDETHVTETADPHLMVGTGEKDELWLWDTPGMSDSARLLARLRRSGDPIGWLLTQVWDRFTNRAFHSSQLAIRTVRDHCDVVLYLTNAAEGPGSSGYVDIEMQILEWMRKPTLVLLNQTGRPQAPEAERRDEAAWQDRLSEFPWVRKVLSLDAFARCWIQEDELLASVEQCLTPEKRDAMAKLRGQWTLRNLQVFEDSMAAIARLLAAAAVDFEKVPDKNWWQKIRRWLPGRPIDPVVTEAMDRLANRLDAALRDCIDELIRLHGLSGSAAEAISARVAEQHQLDGPADPAQAGVVGAVLGGALGGLAADVAAGGVTLGAGALVGGVLGLLGATGAAKAYNAARGGNDGRVRWSPEFLSERVETATLKYLAVAHFGRGRGEWVESEYPPHWREFVAETLSPYKEPLEKIWKKAQSRDRPSSGGPPQPLVRVLEAIVADVVTDVLKTLYAEAAFVFDARGRLGRRSLLTAAARSAGHPREFSRDSV